MIKLRLKAIKLNADFRSSEASNFDALVKKKHFPGPPGKGECYLLVSKSGNQLIWILYAGDTDDGLGGTRRVVDSRRWRMCSGTWDPWMLENYANEVGVSLVGFNRFEAEFIKARADRMKRKND